MDARKMNPCGCGSGEEAMGVCKNCGLTYCHACLWKHIPPCSITQ